MNPRLLKTLGSILAVALAGIAVTFPQYAALATPVATLLAGWLHLPQPGAKP